MQLTYDELTDTLYIYFSHEPVARTEEASHKIVIDYDARGEVRGIEIIGASEPGTSFDGVLPRRDDVVRIIQRTRELQSPVPA